MDKESELIWEAYFNENRDISDKRFEIKVGKIMQGVGEDSDTVNFPQMQLHDDRDARTIEIIADVPGGREYEIAAFTVSVIDRDGRYGADTDRIIRFISDVPEDEKYNFLSRLVAQSPVDFNNILDDVYRPIKDRI